MLTFQREGYARFYAEALPLFQADMQGALAGAAATMVAVLAREDSGGQQVDIATVEVLATQFAGIGLPRYIYEGKTGIRNGARHGLGAYPQTVLPCRDGHVALTAPQLAPR